MAVGEAAAVMMMTMAVPVTMSLVLAQGYRFIVCCDSHPFKLLDLSPRLGGALTRSR